MRQLVARSAHWWWVDGLVGLGVLASWAAGAPAATPVPEGDPVVVRVEEDWELDVAMPEPANDAPQITCSISPGSNIASLHAALEINQRTLPDFRPGGLQLQAWNGEDALSHASSANTAVMAAQDEKVQWTQAMYLQNGNLVFEVLNGNSTTWGAFGGEGSLKVSAAATLGNLNGYDPQVSVNNSGIGFASNRVRSLILKRVRYVTSQNNTYEDAAPRTVYQP